MQFAHPRIVTRNVRQLAKFYEEITSVKPAGTDDYLLFKLPGGTLAISSQLMIDRYSTGAAEPAANRSVVLDFEVEDVDRERSRISAVVGQFLQGPVDRPWGNRSLLFRDPDSNLINFYAPLGDRQRAEESEERGVVQTGR